MLSLSSATFRVNLRTQQGAVTSSNCLRRAILFASTATAVWCALLTSPTQAAVNGTWVRLAEGGTQPPPQRDPGVAYDPLRDRLVAVAGGGSTWVLDLSSPSNWTQLGVPSYSSTGFERAIYDPVGDRMVMINSSMQVYTLSLAAPNSWQLLSVQGGGPAPRSFFAAAHDALRNRLIIFGGGPYTGIFADLWALTLDGTPTWTRIDPTGPPPVPAWGPLAVYDRAGDRLIVGMGSSDIGYSVNSNLHSVNLSGSPEWTPLAPLGASPTARMLPSAEYDQSLNRVLLFGGYPLSDDHIWSLELGSSPAWVQLIPVGVPPGLRWSTGTAMRQGYGDFLIFSGINGSVIADTWVLRGPDVGPPFLDSFSPTAGSVGDQVSIFGSRLSSVSSVSFNGTPASITSVGFSRLEVVVPAGSTTGPLTVTSPAGSATSTLPFLVGERPIVTSATPTSGRIGQSINLIGQHFTGATTVRVGGTGSAPFTVVSDELITFTVDALATTGPITVSTPVGSGTSAFSFTVRADDPRPQLLSVRDVPSDQGGKVLLRWRASDFDSDRHRTIRGYRVWRRAPLEEGAAEKATALGWKSSRSLGLSSEDGGEFWESLAELPAAFLPGYAYAAATLQDSTESGNPLTAFFIQSLTADPFVFYNSPPDSGYSVDNLAPPAPAPFEVQYGHTANILRWRAIGLADLQGYEIHRGTSQDFVPSTLTLLAIDTDTTYIDSPGAHHYRIAARDVHGNRSRFLSASPDRPVGTLVTWLNATRTARRISLSWYSGGNAGLHASVYRREAESDWLQIGRTVADGRGYLEFEDGTIEDGARYAYRLGVLEADGSESFLGEGWVEPLALEVAWARPLINPSVDGRIQLQLSLPANESVDVRLLDVTGRLLDRRAFTAGGGREESMEFSAGSRLRPGVYVVSVTGRSSTLTRRVVVLR